jgi:hypothetical protein
MMIYDPIKLKTYPVFHQRTANKDAASQMISVASNKLNATSLFPELLISRYSDGLNGRGSVPIRSKIFLVLHKGQTGSGAHPASYTIVHYP